MVPNTKNINLRYFIMGLCVTVCIFLLLNKDYTPTIPSQSPSSSPQPSPSSCQNPVLTIYRKIVDVPCVPALTTVRFGGSTTFAPLNRSKIIDTIKKAHPQFRLEHISRTSPDEIPGSSTGVKWLIDNKLSFSQSSGLLAGDQYQKARIRGFTLQQVEVAYDILAIYVNPQLTPNDLKGLTLDQVRDIFIGKIKNWGDVGGPQIPITIIRRQPQGIETEDVFQRDVLDNQPSGGANNKKFRTTTEAIGAVANTPGGVGVTSAAHLINQQMIRVLPIAKQNNSHFVSPCAEDTCHAVNENLIAKQSYPQELLTTKLFVVIKRDRTDNERAGIAYANMLLTDEGQKLVKEAGFVPYRILTQP